MKRVRIEEVGLFDVNFDTGQRYWSRELKQLLGLASDTPADFQVFLQRVYPEDRRAVTAIAMQPFRSDCPRHTTSEFRIMGGDGAIHWVHLERATIFRASPERDVVRVAGFIVEISEPANRPWTKHTIDFAQPVVALPAMQTASI